MGKFGFTAVIGADYSALNNAMKEMDSSSKKLNSELKQINSALKLDPENAVLAAQKLEVMGDAAKEAQKKIEKLESQQEAMNKALQNGDISAEYYREYQREIEKAERTVREFTKAQNEAQKAAEDSAQAQQNSAQATAESDNTLSGWGETMKGILASKAVTILADGIMQAAESLIELGKSSVTAYGELEQNLGGADAVFGKYSESIKSSAEDAYRVMGTSQSEYLATANKMGALFQGSGVDQQRSLELTAQAMQRAADMASVMGIETSAALEAVTGAAKGNYTMMDNLGVAMNATTLKAYALSKGLDVTWDSASNAEKAEIAMQYFFENTEQYAGNFEREARETVSGSIGLLTASVESLMAGLGNSEADIVNLTQNVIDAFGSVKDNVMPVLQAVSDALPQVAQELVEAIPDVIPEVAGMAEEIIAALGEGLEAQLPNITDMAVELLTAFAQKLTEALPAIADGAVLIVTTLADGIGEALPDLVPAAVEAVVKIAESLLDNIDVILDAAIKLIEGLTEGLFRALPGLLQQAPVIIEKLVVALMDAGQALITDVPKAICDGIANGLVGYDWTEGANSAIAGLNEAMKKAADIEAKGDGYEVLGSQEEADARLDAALKELEEKRGQIPEKYRQIQEELKKGAEETADKLADTSTEIAEAAGTAADVGVSETKSENGGEESGVNQKSDMLDKELEELEHKYKTHKVTEEQYWAERKSTLEKYRDDDSEEWNALYDKVTEHYTKLAEAEKKAKEAALKEDTAEAKKRFDALYSQLSDEKITREQFNDEYAALTEELAQKQIDISEYASDKIASYDEKVRKEEMTAWEKSSKEITDKITKTYENVTQAYEKAKSQLISSAKLIDQKVTDTSGADRYILMDFEKKRKELAKYRKDLEKLKETGISNDLMEQVMSLSYDSGERQGYISELLKMSDSQRKKYYKDVDAFYADAGKTAAFEVQDDLTEADRIAKEGIESIYGSMPADAYQKGVETAQAYIDGINKTMADADALRSMGSDFGERSQNSKMQSAASGSSGSTYSPSGTAQGGKSSFYSGDMQITINVAGKQAIKCTLDELIRKGRLADSMR